MTERVTFTRERAGLYVSSNGYTIRRGTADGWVAEGGRVSEWFPSLREAKEFVRTLHPLGAPRVCGVPEGILHRHSAIRDEHGRPTSWVCTWREDAPEPEPVDAFAAMDAPEVNARAVALIRADVVPADVLRDLLRQYDAA